MRIEIQELELLFVLVIYAKNKENRMEIDGVSIVYPKTSFKSFRKQWTVKETMTTI